MTQIRQLLLATALSLFLLNGLAHAANVNVNSQTIGQAYQLITSGGDVLKRSRLNQFLGLNVWDIGGDQTNTWSFVSQLRFDSDFGITNAEADNIEQLKNNNLLLMYGYVQGLGIADMFDIRLGRQLIIDDMDFTMLDGLRFTYHSPINLAFEVVGGLEVKNAFLGVISSTQLETDGDGGAEESGGDDEPSLVIGGSVLLENVRDHHAKVGYRRIMLMGDDGGVDAERVFANYHYRVTPWLHLSGATAWDFIIADISDIRAEIRMPKMGDLVDLELSYWMLVPTFEGSSIFNVFSTQPLNDIDFRVRYHFNKRASAYVGSYLRLFSNLTDADYSDQPDNDVGVDDSISDIGGRTGGRLQLSNRGRVECDITYQTGYGDMTTVDIGGGYDFVDHTFDLTGRFTTVIFDDAFQENLNGVSVGGQIGASYLIRDVAKFHLMTEVNSNKIQTLQFRVFGLVDLQFWL